MVYTNCSFAPVIKLSPNYNKRSDAPKYGYTECIKNIAIHHMAGALSLETCANVFINGKGSSNYGVDNAGNCGCFVKEENRAWTTSTRRDFESITIEVANTPAGAKNKTWEVSDAAIQGLIRLCADICQRNGIKALIWSDSKEDRKSGRGGCNMYIHRDYDNTTCPGDYLLKKLPYVAQEVNKILNGTPAPAPAPAPAPTPSEYGIEQFRADVLKILDAKTCAEAFEKTITISKYKNYRCALVTPLEKYFRTLGYYTGEVEAENGKTPIFGGGMKTATETYQREVVKAIPKFQDGILTKKGATWKKLLF